MTVELDTYIRMDAVLGDPGQPAFEGLPRLPSEHLCKQRLRLALHERMAVVVGMATLVDGGREVDHVDVRRSPCLCQRNRLHDPRVVDVGDGPNSAKDGEVLSPQGCHISDELCIDGGKAVNPSRSP
jgi:hypothetical protein